MIELRTPTQVDQMRPAGRFVAEVLTTLRDEVGVGTNLLDIDARAHEMIRERGAESCYIDYHPSFGASPFGKVICTSVNDAVLHGLPHDYTLADGDLVSLDFAVAVDGWVSDSALSFVVGTPREEDLRLIETTDRALAAGIAAARAGNRIGDIGTPSARSPAGPGSPSTRSSAATGSGARCTATRTCPTTASPGAASSSSPGLVIAIEPWFLHTTDEIFTDPDGWTLRTADGSRGAHMEHTIAITDGDPVVLTQRAA